MQTSANGGVTPRAPLRRCLTWFLHLCPPWMLQAQRLGLKQACVLHRMTWGEPAGGRSRGPPCLCQRGCLGCRMLWRWGEAARAPLAQVDESFLSALPSISLSSHREQGVVWCSNYRVQSGGAPTTCMLGSMTAPHLAAITSQAWRRAPSPPPPPSPPNRLASRARQRHPQL